MERPKRGMKMQQVMLGVLHREALVRLAAAEGEPMAAVVRDLIREEARRRGLWPEHKEVPDAP